MDDGDEWNEWEDKADIPDSLAKKWESDERKGLKAGVCERCGYTYNQEALSCAHCEKEVSFNDGVFPSIKRFFMKTPMGIVLTAVVFIALFIFITR
jgi:hypothetical protein